MCSRQVFAADAPAKCASISSWVRPLVSGSKNAAVRKYRTVKPAPKKKTDVFTVVIIVSLAGGLAGIVVDGVSGVFALGDDQVKPMPVIAALPGADYLVGIGTDGDRMVSLIDIARFVEGLGIPDSLS